MANGLMELPAFGKGCSLTATVLSRISCGPAARSASSDGLRLSGRGRKAWEEVLSVETARTSLRELLNH